MILYKKDSKGKIRFIEFQVDGDQFSYTSGEIGTDNPVTHSKICKAKNVGRSNETTPEQQAQLEMKAKIKNKLDRGYFKTISEAQNTEVILPMLAKDYFKEKSKIDWSNAYCQPKLDGNRALLFVKNKKGKLISRQNKEFIHLSHITDKVNLPDGIYDGELYAHGYPFSELMELIKKECDNTVIKYYAYDMISNLSFKYRFMELMAVVDNLEHIKLTSTVRVYSEKDLEKEYSTYIQEGYEGAMLRWGKEPYKMKARSSNLLKYKKFIDIALPIIDIEPADQKPKWGVPVFEINGETFRAGTKLSHKEREDLLKNKDKYIGRTGEIRFFEYSKYGVPRFPVFCGIRLDK